MDYYNEIKNELIGNEITKRVKDYSKNKSDLNTYYNVGKLLSNAGKHYGDGIIKEYSIKLKNEVNKKYSVRTLFRIKQFYNIFSLEKVSTLSTQLTWSHYSELIILNNLDEINYYIDISIKQNLTVRQLRERIKNKEYERLPEDTRNKLIAKEDSSIKDFIKNPILIKNNSNSEIISEKILQELILEDIESFMKELGDAFCFIGSEYKIKLGNNYNYIDLLLFNYKYNCFVVVELKITELKKEHIGQIEIYMNYIDKNVKELNHDSTIGIIICRKNNKFVMEYCSDKKILAKEYELV